MTERRARWLAWAIVVLTGVSLVIQVLLQIRLVDVPTGGDWSFGSSYLMALFIILLILSFTVSGLLLATRRASNPLGWLLLAFGALMSLPMGAYGTYSYEVATLPFGPWAYALDQWTWVPAIGILGTYTILLFPDGHLPSPRWRWLGWLSFVAIVLGSVSIMFDASPIELTPGRTVPNPFGIDPITPALSFLQVSLVLLPICIVASAVGLVVRFRRSTGTERQQMKWLAFAGSFVAALYFVVMAMGLPYAFAETKQPEWLGAFQIVALFSFALIPISIGIAVLRYRLFDIDLVISKTLIFGVLGAFITLLYVAVVVGVGALVGDPTNPALSITATVLVALAFGPVRARVRRWANRRVYGERATPYEVMAGFARQVSGALSIDRVLPGMAEAAGRGVGASAATVRVALPGGDEHAVTWPDDAAPATEPDVVLPVRHHGDEIGSIEVSKAVGDPVTGAERALLDDLASQAGLALHNVRLTDELTIRTEELAEQSARLAASRQRLVTARDEQRRRLEREIREGPSAQLETIRLGVETVDALATSDADAAAAELDRLGADANVTLETLRDLARGIFPPLLVDKGTVAALEAHARKVGVNASVEATPAFAATRFDPDVEACVYFCCLQALQNVHRHGGNAHATIALDTGVETVTFRVTDEGPGFDPATTEPGMGTAIMRDRVDALDGTLAIESAPGRGTTITGVVPARPTEAVGS